MLVLSRKIGESLVIDDQIVIRVLGTQTGRIRIGVEAPPDVNIRRAELPPRSEQPIEEPLVVDRCR